MKNAGQDIMNWAEQIARHSEPAWAEKNQLTCTYLTPAHLNTAKDIKQLMQDAGFDEVSIDAVGNVVGLYRGQARAQQSETNHEHLKTLLTGSHYDTVRNGGKYDGRLGILIPIACVAHLSSKAHRLPFDFEVVAFSEEEGQRFRATFLASGALTGDFDPAWLDQQDADGVTMRQAMQNAGLPGDMSEIRKLKRDPDKYIGLLKPISNRGLSSARGICRWVW